MRRSHVMNSAASVAAACLVVAGLTGFASTGTDKATDAVAAIEKAAPAAVAGLAATRTDEDTAAQALVDGGAMVSVPVDPSTGVDVATPGDAPDVSIGLPFADQASLAADSPVAGVVVYDNNNGSATVPAAHKNGTVQIITVIENARAPKRYDYPISVAAGQTLQLQPDGAVYLLNDDRKTAAAVIAAPWARDADGAPVPTHYEVTGGTLTQIVDFTPATAFVGQLVQAGCA